MQNGVGTRAARRGERCGTRPRARRVYAGPERADCFLTISFQCKQAKRGRQKYISILETYFDGNSLRYLGAYRSCRPDTPSPRLVGPQAPAKDTSPPIPSQRVLSRPVVLVHRQFPGACRRKRHPGRVSGPSTEISHSVRIHSFGNRKTPCLADTIIHIVSSDCSQVALKHSAPLSTSYRQGSAGLCEDQGIGRFVAVGATGGSRA